MSYPHIIRLRGPWEYEVLDDLFDASPREKSSPHRCEVPGDWGAFLGAGFRGRVRYTRHFNLPTGLLPHDRVWLVCEGADARSRVTLNGQALGEIDGYALPAAFPITGILQPRNELVIDVDLPPPDDDDMLRPGRIGRPGGLIGEVRLEIRTPHFVEGLIVFCTRASGSAPQWEIRGRIGGETSDSPPRIIVSDGKSDLRLDGLRVGEEFAVESNDLELPVWRPDLPALEAISLELCPGVSAAAAKCQAEWVAQIPTACGPVGIEHAKFFVPAVESPAFYEDLDGRGIPVVQFLPLQWERRLGHRLAHHPSIVAWSVNGDALAAWVHARNQLTPAGEEPMLWGRPLGSWRQVRNLPVLAGLIPQ